MDINKFVEECLTRYKERGVTAVEISVWGGICSIYLTRPEGYPKNDNPNVISVGIDAGLDEPISACFAHLKYEMPIKEEEVWKGVEGWLNDKDDDPDLEGYENTEFSKDDLEDQIYNEDIFHDWRSQLSYRRERGFAMISTTKEGRLTIMALPSINKNRMATILRGIANELEKQSNQMEN